MNLYALVELQMTLNAMNRDQAREMATRAYPTIETWAIISSTYSIANGECQQIKL